MITLDTRTPNERRDSNLPEFTDLQHHLSNLKVPSVFSRLDFGDASLLGYGPAEIPVLVGVEIKKVPDVLACMQDGRFSAHQLPGMCRSYSYRYLVVEGPWRPDEHGYVTVPRGQGTWSRPGTQMLASGLGRWLLTMDVMCGMRVIPTRDRQHTARFLSDLWHWWSQPWGGHDAHLALEEFHAGGANQQHLDLTIPKQEWRLCRDWAAAIPSLGRIKAGRVADHFETAYQLATAKMGEWLKIKGIGKGIAAEAVKLIGGPPEEKE